MNISRMIQKNYIKNKLSLRFKYYGEFETIKLIHTDCKDDIFYIGNSNIDGAPIFEYFFKTEQVTEDLLKDIPNLNIFLRSLRLKRILKKEELTDNEKSFLTFLDFFINCDENHLIKGVSFYEIKFIHDEYIDEN